jgi:microcystin-dependent protein
MKYLKRVTTSTLTLLAATATFASAPNLASADSNPYLGDILAVGQNFCPRGWTVAQGQLLAISEYTALFSLLGTVYGGDGRTTFGLPDLRSRVPMGRGNGPGLAPRVEGQKFGAETHTFTNAEMPSHSHAVRANNLEGDKGGPGGKLLAARVSGHETIYSDQPATRTMSAEMITHTGGGQPFSLQGPFLTLNYCIALQGLFPSRS